MPTVGENAFHQILFHLENYYTLNQMEPPIKGIFFKKKKISSPKWTLEG